MGNIIIKKKKEYELWKDEKKINKKILRISTSQDFSTASLTPQKCVKIDNY